MGKLFGTDGVRGIANADLNAELAFRLGMAGSYVLAQHNSSSRPRILVGKDTRISGDMLEAALVAGICATGSDALLAGIVPTPAVAFLTLKYGASCGIVISASHNPVEDNGIKFFGSNGYKLLDEIEDEIEEVLEKQHYLKRMPVGGDVGRVYHLEDGLNNYLKHLRDCYTLDQDLKNIRMVVDCANGAAYAAAPMLWEELGARVITIGNKPNGLNINDRCGSTHTDYLRRTVLENKADIGIAYDGDADRCIAVDECGQEIDGDQIMCITALDMQRRGLLHPSEVVATVMSNIGLNIALRRENIGVSSCKVGDRYVLEKMLQNGAILGGEQSGHIIFKEHATSGDGLLTSLKLLEVMQRTSLPLSRLAAEMEKQPQLLVNIKLENVEQVMAHESVVESIARAQQKLGEWGKLVVRPSGTEPLLRIMAQGPDQYLLKEVIEDIKSQVEQLAEKYSGSYV
ncbi:MAG: phosphoglucosamine mutase [Syntrophomonadaceae bacterium]|jgi:phosphoglucosamine mutase|nr:phosphoglucosamine mutase [Syntrophomonadaceae bacterium]